MTRTCRSPLSTNDPFRLKRRQQRKCNLPIIINGFVIFLFCRMDCELLLYQSVIDAASLFGNADNLSSTAWTQTSIICIGPKQLKPHIYKCMSNQSISGGWLYTKPFHISFPLCLLEHLSYVYCIHSPPIDKMISTVICPFILLAAQRCLGVDVGLI